MEHFMLDVMQSRIFVIDHPRRIQVQRGLIVFEIRDDTARISIIGILIVIHDHEQVTPSRDHVLHHRKKTLNLFPDDVGFNFYPDHMSPVKSNPGK